MLGDTELMCDFTILQTVRNQAHHVFFSARQQWRALGIVELEGLRMDDGVNKCSMSWLLAQICPS